jgi:nicotinamidase-related amidase
MEKKILVIVDAQNDFIDGALGSEAAQACVSNICDRLSGFKDGLIITTQDTHTHDYLNTKEGFCLPVEHCIKNTHGWGINSEIAASIVSSEVMNENEYKYVYKPTFGSTDLMATIESYTNGEKFTITFMGFCTDICVISNVLMTKALFFDKADIYVDSKCCAGVTEDKHNAALEVMRSCQIHVI